MMDNIQREVDAFCEGVKHHATVILSNRNTTHEEDIATSIRSCLLLKSTLEKLHSSLVTKSLYLTAEEINAASTQGDTHEKEDHF